MRFSVVGVLATTLILLSTAALSRVLIVDVTADDVRSFAPSDERLGDYYVIDLPIPEGIDSDEFVDAILEMSVDASSDVDIVTSVGFVTLEVYPLKSPVSGELAASDLRPSAMKSTVVVGESRPVRIHIGEYVRYALEHPAEDFGLVVGSLTGQRLGKFVLRNGTLGDGIAARVTFVY